MNVGFRALAVPYGRATRQRLNKATHDWVGQVFARGWLPACLDRNPRPDVCLTHGAYDGSRGPVLRGRYGHVSSWQETREGLEMTGVASVAVTIGQGVSIGYTDEVIERRGGLDVITGASRVRELSLLEWPAMPDLPGARVLEIWATDEDAVFEPPARQEAQLRPVLDEAQRSMQSDDPLVAEAGAALLVAARRAGL